MDDDQDSVSGPDSDGDVGPALDVAFRDGAVDDAVAAAPPPVIAAPAGVLQEGADVWHQGWMRPVPDIAPTNKAVRNRGEKLTDGPSAYARGLGLSTPVKAFLALWSRELMERIQRVTTVKLAARDLPDLSTHELVKFIALEITMGLKKQGSVRSYYDTSHFGASNDHHCFQGINLTFEEPVITNDGFRFDEQNVDSHFEVNYF